MKRRIFVGTSKTLVIGSLAIACAFSSSVTASAAAARPNVQPPYTANFFGISAGAEITNLPDAEFDREMNMMQKIGVHWLRAVFPWAKVQSQSADPLDEEWVYIDRLYNYARALGMQIDAIIDNAPLWAQESVPTISCTKQPSFNLTAYANFAAEVAARYPTSVVNAIELQNAPNLPGNWVVPDACGYTELMRQSYPKIKAANPTVTVLTGGLGAQNAIRKGQQVIAGDVFFGQMYGFGAQGYFDALSWHPYSYPCFPSQTCSQNRPWYRTPVVRKLMVDHGDGAKKIWATEFGSPTGGSLNDGHVDEPTQSAMMVDAMQLWVTYSYGGPFFVFAFRDAGTDPTRKNNWFGIVSRDFKHKKIAYSTYQSLATG